LIAMDLDKPESLAKEVWGVLQAILLIWLFCVLLALVAWLCGMEFGVGNDLGSEPPWG